MTSAPAAERFLQTADLLPEAMLLVRADGRVAAANRAAARLFGRPKSELAERPLQSLVWDDAVRLGSILGACARTRELLPGALTVRAADASCLPCRCEGAVFEPRSGDSPALVLLRLSPREEAIGRFVALSQRVEVLSQEIARRRRLEAALHEERERLRVTLESIGDAVMVTDIAGRITFMNRVAEQLTGWNMVDALDRPAEQVFVVINQDTREPVASPIARVLRDGVTVGLANHTLLIARDGSERPIDDSGAPVRDSHGRMIGVVLVFHDVSERDAMERALRRHAEHLVLADRRKDEFLAMLSHELRNPLAPLGNAVALLRTLEQPQACELAGLMDRQLRHLTTLVNDLLDVSRITRGTITLQRAPIALVDALRLALELAGPTIEHGGHALSVQLPDDTVTVNGDLHRIAQVFANLLSNAAKYTAPGGRIELCYEQRRALAQVSVRDNGIGLPAELLDKVFELFQQDQRSLDRAQGGLGVGLTVARALVEMHGGHIAARSAGVGHGCEFVVWLPLLWSG